VVAWLQDDVLQRSIPARGPRKGPKRRVGRPLLSELAAAGARARAGCLDAVDAGSSSSDLEDSEGSNSPKSLTAKTVKVYIAAIAEIYYIQVSLGLNKHPNFRSAALKAFIKGLMQKQAQKH